MSSAGSQLTWFNRSGKNLSTIGQPDIYATPALSPDGTRLGVTVGENGKGEIWVYDLKRGSASRLTFDPVNEGKGPSGYVSHGPVKAGTALG